MIRNLGLGILGITCPVKAMFLAGASVTHGRRCWPRSTTPALSRSSFENSRPQTRQLSHGLSPIRQLLAFLSTNILSIPVSSSTV